MSSTQLVVGNAGEDAIAKHVARCKTVAFNVSACNRQKAQDAVSKIYATAGFRPPQYFVWFPSPFAASLAAVLLSKTNESYFENVIARLKGRCSTQLWKMIEAKGTSLWWGNVRDALTREIDKSFGTIPQQTRLAMLAYLIGPVGPRLSMQNLSSVDMELAPPKLTQGIIAELSKVLPARYTEPLITYGERGLSASVANSAISYIGKAGYGNQDADLPFYDFCRGAGFKIPDMDGFFQLANVGGWWFPFQDFCIMVEKPSQITVNPEGLLHHELTSALAYRDNWKTFAWHGVFVPDRFLTFAKRKNVDDILMEPNVELRRMMLDMYGLDNFINDSGAQKIQEDKCGILYRQEFGDDDEPLVIVKVINSTPEPDGTYNIYFLRVPPTTQTAREGIAWTFGLTPEEYFPLRET